MKKILISTLFIMTLLSSFCFAEERFVCEYMGAGFYAEVDNLEISGDYFVTNITIKKPFYNKFIKETLRFNTAEGTYEVLKRDVYQYNPKKFVESEKVYSFELPLPEGSPYEAVVNFIFAWQNRAENDI